MPPSTASSRLLLPFALLAALAVGLGLFAFWPKPPPEEAATAEDAQDTGNSRSETEQQMRVIGYVQ